MNTVISVKIDKDLKDSAQEVIRSAGLTISAVLNSYLRQIVATRRIEIYSPEQMTPKLESIIVEIEKDISANLLSDKFDNAKDFLADLKKN